jgi:hypothetical protein
MIRRKAVTRGIRLPFAMFALVLAMGGSFLTVPALAATPGTRLWERLSQGDASYALAVAPSGRRLFIGGTIQLEVGQPTEYRTASYTSEGTIRWSRAYRSPGDDGGTIHAISVSPGGRRVFVTGESASAVSSLHDIATIAYRASDGARLWARRYDGAGAGTDVAYSTRVSPDGSTLFLSGVSTGLGSWYDYVTIAYDTASGTRLWTTLYDGSGNGGEDIAYALDISPDGEMVAVTGLSTNADGGVDFATVGYNATTGAEMWATRFNGLGDDQDYGQDIAFGPDGAKVFVTGRSGRDNASNYADYATLAYDSTTGAELWGKLYDGPAHSQDAGYAIAVTSDGSSVVVTGNSIGLQADYDFATVAYDTDMGDEMWAKRYGVTSGAADDAREIDVEISPDGSKAFVAGSSDGGGTYLDIATLAYSVPTGGRLWVRRFDSSCGYRDFASDLAVGPVGTRVYVTGYRACFEATRRHWVTLAFAA